jgi:hypothetical protein
MFKCHSSYKNNDQSSYQTGACLVKYFQIYKKNSEHSKLVCYNCYFYKNNWWFSITKEEEEDIIMWYHSKNYIDYSDGCITFVCFPIILPLDYLLYDCIVFQSSGFILRSRYLLYP